MLFCEDNASGHKSVMAMAKINEYKFELLPHPPYSPDLARLDYFLFPNLKENGSVVKNFPRKKNIFVVCWLGQVVLESPLYVSKTITYSYQYLYVI